MNDVFCVEKSRTSLFSKIGRNVNSWKNIKEPQKEKVGIRNMYVIVICSRKLKVKKTIKRKPQNMVASGPTQKVP